MRSESLAAYHFANAAGKWHGKVDPCQALTLSIEGYIRQNCCVWPMLYCCSTKKTFNLVSNVQYVERETNNLVKRLELQLQDSYCLLVLVLK